MKTRYNVLWIDDEHEKIDSFFDDADNNGFDITPFKSSAEGEDFLLKNVRDVDAIILDVKVYKEDGDKTATLAGFQASIKAIERIKGSRGGREIPYVVFTGQPDLKSDSWLAELMNGTDIFYKGAGTKLLFNRLRELIESSPEATLRNRYRDAYEACTKGCVDRNVWDELSPILRSLDAGQVIPSDSFNGVRRALEWVFRMLHKKNILHSQLVNPTNVDLRCAAKFLSGREVKTRSGEILQAKSRVFPAIIGGIVTVILDVTNPGSHTEDDDGTPEKSPMLSRVVKYVPNHHLLRVVTLMLLDLVVWVDGYVKDHPEPSENAKNWEAPNEESGTSARIGPIAATIVNVIQGRAFAKPDDSRPTRGENIMIPEKMWPIGSLNMGDKVEVSSKGRDNERGNWPADSCRKIS